MRIRKIIAALAMVNLLLLGSFPSANSSSNGSSSSSSATHSNGTNNAAARGQLNSASLPAGNNSPFSPLENTMQIPEARNMNTAATEHPMQSHPVPAVEPYLIKGDLKAGEIALTAQLKEHPKDDQLRFGLGVLQFLRALERLAQDLYFVGMKQQPVNGISLPILRLPVPKNPNPNTLTYVEARRIAKAFGDNLANAEITLSTIQDPDVKLPLHFGLIRLDLNGDGRCDNAESLWQVYASLRATSAPEFTINDANKFVICFDRGDVHWLRGYCHLLSALCDIYLAHDTKESFERTAHVFFEKVDSPYHFLNSGKRVHRIFGDDVDLLDLVAIVHLINWRVVEPNHMLSALHHLETCVAQGKESWKWFMAETDDDREWIPNPRQTGVIPNVRVTDEMVKRWLQLLDDTSKILKGEVLIPFWRGETECGVNLRKVFTEPRTLDLVLWVQGTAAAPYLQKGHYTSPETWHNLNEAFNGQFVGFAVWFN